MLRSLHAPAQALLCLLAAFSAFPADPAAADPSRRPENGYLASFGVNPTVDVDEAPISTFPTSTRATSYELLRACLKDGELPGVDQVRVEDFVNALDYGYEPPDGDLPFAVHLEAFPSPSRKGYLVVRIGLKARDAVPPSPSRLVARDVEVRVEFDRDNIRRYRLLGYEELLPPEKLLDDDRLEAGRVRAGHEVTALYEVKLKTQRPLLGQIHLRWRTPDTGKRQGMTRVLSTAMVRTSMEKASASARLSLVAATFAEKLRGSYWVRRLGWTALEKAARALPEETRRRPDVGELLSLIGRAHALDPHEDRLVRRRHTPESDFDEVPVLVPE